MEEKNKYDGKGLTGFYDDTTGGISRFTKKTSRGVTGIYDDTTGGIKRFFTEKNRRWLF